MKLETTVSNIAGHIRDPVFGHRRLYNDLLLLHVIRDQLVHKGAAYRDFRGAFHQRELVDLKLGNRLSKNRPLPAILGGYIQQVFGLRDDTYGNYQPCLLYTSPSPRDRTRSRMPSSA